MKILSPSSYRKLFFRHLLGFLGNVTSGKELAGPHVIAVSGGLDSMSLLWVAQELYRQGKIGSIRVVFVHHHTRPGQQLDADLVEEFCERACIPFKILHAEGLNQLRSNFEERARRARRSLLKGELKYGELLWLGHHIDDSYEWSIMQRYRSGLPKSSLGIPVRNGPILRPFLCMTKAQLQHLCRHESIPYRDDPTNLDSKYDRNFLRHEILPLIKKRYPQFLKHYVNHANHMAAVLNLSITTRISGNKMFIFHQGAVIEGPEYSSFQIQELLHYFSQEKRGKITSQILKMIKAIDHGKKGPFHFSGGTEAYSSFGLLMIYQQKMKNNDHSIAEILKTLSVDDLQQLPKLTHKDLDQAWRNLLYTPDAMLNMPGPVLILEGQSINKTLNSSVYDSVFPEVSRLCQEKGLRFITCVKCLREWERKKTKLPETLRLLPLWTLSNLFPSQE